MTTAYDVPAERLIDIIATQFKRESKVQPPEWSAFAKTGVHKEKSPAQDDWWYTRLAAVLRKVYTDGPIGSERMAALFGGKEDRGVKPSKARAGSRAVARHCLKQLEELGYVSVVEKKGRRISPAGQSLLDNASHDILKKMAKDEPELTKYL
ncbi:MAG: 30S ribosomal protein S19e [Thermoplasmata archaeon]|nr:30S ribosomal protein S19e [Thermoplasmata archaeon]